VRFLQDAVIHFLSALVDALDKAHRTGGHPPFHLIRREAVSFANLKTFVPGSPFGYATFRMQCF
jgi:hypothetical protein